jgi:hypothetical protein
MLGDRFLKWAARGEIEYAIQDLNPAGRAACLGATLIVVRDPVADRNVEQQLAIRRFDRGVLEIGHLVHGFGPVLLKGAVPTRVASLSLRLLEGNVIVSK